MNDLQPSDAVRGLPAVKRPPAVIVVAALYLAVGAVGFVAHFPRRWHTDDVWIEITEAIAAVCGVFLLRRKNWARWLALAWMAFHVLISVAVLRQAIVHLLLLGVIAWALFRPGTEPYFTGRSRGRAQ